MWPYIAIGLAVIFGIIFHDLQVLSASSSIFAQGAGNIFNFSSAGFSATRSPLSPNASAYPLSTNGWLYPQSTNDSRSDFSAAASRGWKIFFWMLIACLTLMAGLRYRIGMDTIVLSDALKDVPGLSDLPQNFSRENQGRFLIIYALLRECGLGLWPWFLLCAILLNGMFAIRVARLTRFPFVAIGFYLIYSYITLNFETMIAGVAAGALLWALPDIRDRRYLRFYLKLACGAFFHLSILLLCWLPLLGSPRIRRILTDWKYLLMLVMGVLIAAISTRTILPWAMSICDHSSLLTSLGFSTSYALPYADVMLTPEHLNWKGYLGIGFRRVGVPLLAAGLIIRGSRQEDIADTKNKDEYSFFASVLVVIALLGIVRFEVNGFSRMSMLLWPMACIALTRSLDFVKRPREVGVWAFASLAALTLCLKGLWSPIELTGEDHRIELYVPYSDCVSKGVCYHREWLAYGYVQKTIDQDCEAEPVYDFGFALRETEHEIASVFNPKCTHENMEQLRQEICGSDSIAPTVPFNTPSGPLNSSSVSLNHNPS